MGLDDIAVVFAEDTLPSDPKERLMAQVESLMGSPMNRDTIAAMRDCWR